MLSNQLFNLARRTFEYLRVRKIHVLTYMHTYRVLAIFPKIPFLISLNARCAYNNESTLWNRSRSRITAISAHRSMTLSLFQSPSCFEILVCGQAGRNRAVITRSATPENAYSLVYTILVVRIILINRLNNPRMWESPRSRCASYRKVFFLSKPRVESRLISYRAIFRFSISISPVLVLETREETSQLIVKLCCSDGGSGCDRR